MMSDSKATKKSPEKRVPNEDELKQRFEFRNWSIALSSLSF